MSPRALIMIPLAALAACAPEEPPPQSTPAAAACSGSESTQLHLGDEIELGTREGSAFRPVADGDELALERGTQGGYMITPAVRIPASPDVTAACATVELVNRVVGGGAAEVTPGLRARVRFDRIGDDLLSGAFDNLLGYEARELYGLEIEVEAVVDPDGSDIRTKRRVLIVE